MYKLILSLMASFCVATSDPVFAGSLEVSKPNVKEGQKATLEVTITKEGKDLKCPVSGIESDDTAEGKAIKIKDAINSKFTKGAPASINEKNKKQVDVEGYSIVISKDKTHEREGKSSLNAPIPGAGPLLAEIDYHGLLTGLDENGNNSTFTASLGFTGFTDTATVSFSSLSEPTVDGVATSIYEQLLLGLPSSLKQNLFLDLPLDEITFTFPGYQTNYFVSNASTDTGVELTFGLVSTIPEPASMALLALGSVSLGFIGRKRKNVGN